LLKHRPDFYLTHHPRPDEELLAVEIADSSLPYDRDVKIPIYSARGVIEAWIVDLAGNALLVFRMPEAGGYKECLTLQKDDSISPVTIPDFAVKVGEILG
jgi:Uma2 family endonuclease